MTIEDLIKQYLDYLEIEKNRSLKTRDNYRRYLYRYLLWLSNYKNKSTLSLNDIDEESVRNYRLWLNRQTNLSGDNLKKNTQSYYLIALRNFLKYLTKRGFKVLPPEKIELPKVPEREIELISIEELERLLAAPSNNDLKGKRDKAILETLFSTGLRVSELTKLNRDSIDFKRDEFSVRGKGGKIRVVFLSERAKQALKNYLESRKDIDEALFVSFKKNGSLSRLTSRSIERIIKFYAAKAGLTKKVTPHTLRHLFATDLLQGGADLRSVQALLGHSSINTTQIYTHLTDKELKEVHRAFHGKRLKRN